MTYALVPVLSVRPWRLQTFRVLKLVAVQTTSQQIPD